MEFTSDVFENNRFVVKNHFIHVVRKHSINDSHSVVYKLTEDKKVRKVVYEIPLSDELKNIFSRETVYVCHMPIKKFQCFASCDINDERVFLYLNSLRD